MASKVIGTVISAVCGAVIGAFGGFYLGFYIVVSLGPPATPGAGEVMVGFLGAVIGGVIGAGVLGVLAWTDKTNIQSYVSSEAYKAGEVELYSRESVKVTNKRLIVPPYEWDIAQFQPVKVEWVAGSYRINLLDRNGNRVHFFTSDDKNRIGLIAEAINKALNQ